MNRPKIFSSRTLCIATESAASRPAYQVRADVAVADAAVVGAPVVMTCKRRGTRPARHVRREPRRRPRRVRAFVERLMNVRRQVPTNLGDLQRRAEPFTKADAAHGHRHPAAREVHDESRRRGNIRKRPTARTSPADILRLPPC